MRQLNILEQHAVNGGNAICFTSAFQLANNDYDPATTVAIATVVGLAAFATTNLSVAWVAGSVISSGLGYGLSYLIKNNK